MRLSSGLLVVVLFLTVAGCSTHPPPDEGASSLSTPASDEPMHAEQEKRGVGTITYLDLEGGFYGLVADDGARYDPLNLEEAYREDRLRVRFRVRIKSDVMTIRMWGTPVEVVEMERYEE